MSTSQPVGSPRRRRVLQAAAASAALSGLGVPAIVRGQASALKVGVLLPRSGFQGFIGQSCQKGADLAPGVIKEMLGVNIELMNADTETNIDTARTRAERLIQEGANVLVGPFDSGAAAAIAQVAEQRGVPFVINIAAAPQITEQGYRYVFRNFQTAGDIVPQRPRPDRRALPGDQHGAAHRRVHARERHLRPGDGEGRSARSCRSGPSCRSRSWTRSPMTRRRRTSRSRSARPRRPRRISCCSSAASTTRSSCAARWSSSAGTRWAW